MSNRDFILPCSLGCMLYGIWLSFCEIFDCKVNDGSYLIPAFVIAVIVILLFLPWRTRTTLVIFASGIVVGFLYIVKHIERLSVEFSGICYYINQRSYEYYHTTLFDQQTESSMENTLLWILLGILFGTFITLFVFRLKMAQYGFLPCYLIVFAGLMLGRAPGVKGMMFLVVGMVLALFWLSGQERGGSAHFRMIKVRRQGVNWHRYLLFFLLLAAALVTAGQITKGTEERLLSHGEEVQKTQIEIEKKVIQMADDASDFIRGRFNLDSDGKLNNDEPRYAERPVLEVTVSQKPTSDIYLKGFVGSHYHQGEWTQEDVKTFQNEFPENDSREMLASLGNNDLDAWKSLKSLAHDLFDEEDDEDDIEIGHMSYFEQMQIKHVGRGKWSTYTYVPYFSNISGMLDADTGEYLDDLSKDFLRGDSSRENVSSFYSIGFIPMGSYERQAYYENYFPLLLEDQLVDVPENFTGQFNLQDLYNILQSEPQELREAFFLDYSSLAGTPLRGDKETLDRYINLDFLENSPTLAFCDIPALILRRYLQYAWEEYGYQGESNFFDRIAFKKKLKEYNNRYEKKNYTAGMDTMDRVKFVQNILEENAVYSKELDSVPVGEDYAEYFLLRQKKGFCEHFATAGTLLMRELGIPSRYVGGYKIPVRRFVENEDGMYTARVLDSDAHAWTEVLAGQLGWFPAEMTPSVASRNRQRARATAAAATTKAPATATPERQKEPEETPAEIEPTPEVEVTATPMASQKRGKQGKKELPEEIVFLGKITAGIAGILLLLGTWILCCRIYYNSRKKRLLHAREKNRNLYVRMGLHDLLSYMRTCGVAVSGEMPERKWLLAVEGLWGVQSLQEDNFCQEDREELLRIVQKAAFSKGEITIEELDAFRNFAEKLECAAGKKAGKLRRVYLKLTGKYGKI